MEVGAPRLGNPGSATERGQFYQISPANLYQITEIQDLFVQKIERGFIILPKIMFLCLLLNYDVTETEVEAVP